MVKTILKIIFIFSTAFLVSFFAFTSLPRNSLKVFDQPKGLSVKIETVGLAKDGFIIVAPSLQEKFFVFGEDPRGSEYLPAGIYRDFWISFREPVEETAIPDYVLVGIFLDNGDGVLEDEADRMVEIKRIRLY